MRYLPPWDSLSSQSLRLSQISYLEEPDASEAIAAAEVVAALKGRPCDALSEFPEVLVWIEEHTDWVNVKLIRDAASAVERVRTASELRDLWSQSEEFPAWAAQLDDLLSRLQA